MYSAYFVDPFSLSKLVNHDDVIIRANTIANAVMTGSFVTRGNFGYWIWNPPWFPWPRQAEYLARMLVTFSVPCRLKFAPRVIPGFWHK